MKIQDYIKHENTGFWISVGAVIVQALHSQYILAKLSSLGGSLAEFHSFAISILISGSVLYFTVKGKTKVAIWAAVLESYFNICYYILYINNSDKSWYYLFIALPSSFALPTVLALFSHEIVEDNKKLIEVENDVPIRDLTFEFEELLEDLKQLKDKITTIENKPEFELKGKELNLEFDNGKGIQITKVKVK